MEGLLTTCQACGGKVSKAAAACPQCGHPMHSSIRSVHVPMPYESIERQDCFACDGKGSTLVSGYGTGRNSYNKRCEPCGGSGKISRKVTRWI